MRLSLIVSCREKYIPWNVLPSARFFEVFLSLIYFVAQKDRADPSPEEVDAFARELLVP